jgi:DNA-binding MarR family transcriptional regulator
VDDRNAAPSSAAADGLVAPISSSVPVGHAVGFLLSQLGYAVTRRFRADLEDLALEPRHFGLMRAVAAGEDLSQQALGETLHIPASSIVALLDQLEARGFVRRRLDPGDRRIRVVELTEEGQDELVRAVEISVAIEGALCRGFDADQRESLIANLQKVAVNVGLTLGLLPGSTAGETNAGPGKSSRRSGVEQEGK